MNDPPTVEFDGVVGGGGGVYTPRASITAKISHGSSNPVHVTNGKSVWIPVPSPKKFAPAASIMPWIGLGPAIFLPAIMSAVANICYPWFNAAKSNPSL